MSGQPLPTGSLSIDMADPSVQEMLGTEDRVVRPGRSRRELVQLAGDAPDPTGQSSFRGAQSTHRLNAAKEEVEVVYKDFLLTVDVYRHEGAPIQVHLICPRCRHASRITGDRKAIDFDPTRNTQAGGLLSIEPFECTWELTDDKHTPGLIGGGINLCKLRLGITNNVARDA